MVSRDVEGYLACAIAIVFFGSNFVPVKKVETADGMFFSLMMTLGVFALGTGVNIYQDSPDFEPFAMLGGALWATGNISVCLIIEAVGLGMGMLVWGMANMCAGWASGYFGLFGLDKQEVKNQWLNVCGVLVALCSLVLYSLVKPSVSSDKRKDLDKRPLLGPDASPTVAPPPRAPASSTTFVSRLSPVQKRIFGISASIIAGLFYGTNFDPPQYLIDHPDGDKHSTDSVDYVFSHFTGILLTTTLYFLIYCVVTKHRPQLPAQCAVPAFVSGLMWAVAQVAWFIANSRLGFTTSFPIITTGPGIVASLWGVLVFKEIEGRRNFLVLLTAIGVSILGVVLIALGHQA